MVELLSNLINEKRVLVLGFGMEGRSTYGLITNIGSFSKLGIADISPPGDAPGCTVYSGAGYLDHIDDYDIAFKSPGVVLPKDYREYKCVVTSQTEVFLQSFGKQVIGITGTKGKSTVSSLLHHVLSENNIPCLLAGNIGKPVFEIAGDIMPETAVILELSSHQLEICRVSPCTAVLLNIFEDHLDHYGTFDKYVRAKKNIYLHQRPQDVLYCSEGVKPAGGEAVSRTVVVDTGVLPFGSLENIDGVKLRGRHNLDNCAFAYSIAKSCGVTSGQFVASLRSYVPLRHRLEYIGSKDGVDYYDDSISTTVESAISAIESIANASTVILGGMDRGIDYTALAEFLSHCKLSNVICMYESGRRIFGMLERQGGTAPTVTCCTDLTAAVKTAREVTPKGGACLLSPASASYGDFKNFEERGEAYRSMVFGR